MLTSIEIKYWFTKLKIVELMWLIKRIRHMIEIVNVTSQIIIYTNYSIIINIVKQTKLSFNNTNKLNFQLIKTFIYLSQYRFDVRHKLEKQYIIFDVFFKLFFNVETIKKTLDSNQSKNILNIIYYVTLIKMFDEFKSKLKKIYRINKRWIKIMKLIKLKTLSSIVTNQSIVENFFTSILSIAKQFFILSSIELQTLESTSTNSSFIVILIVSQKSWFELENLRFRYRDDLIYYINDLNEQKRFCIFKSLVDEIFALTHDKLSYIDFYKIYDRIVIFFYTKIYKKNSNVCSLLFAILIKSHRQTLVLRIITFYSIINNIFSHNDNEFYFCFVNYRDKTRCDIYCHMQIHQKNIVNFRKKHVFDKTMSKYSFYNNIKTWLKCITSNRIKQK